jgi:hypothetical protein
MEKYKMKLGTQTASVVNHLVARGTIGQPEPVIGMGVTMLGWTDRAPGTIVEIFKKGSFLYIAVQADTYKRTDKNGMSECQQYEYTPNPNGYIDHYRRSAINANAPWVGTYQKEESGRWLKGHGQLRIGEREKYHDFSF